MSKKNPNRSRVGDTSGSTTHVNARRVSAEPGSDAPVRTEPVSAASVGAVTGSTTPGGAKTGSAAPGSAKAGSAKAGYNSTGYNSYGYNSTGYNSTGYNSYGYNSTGYNSTGYNSTGYNSTGYNSTGYNSTGYNSTGYNSSGYNSSGWPGYSPYVDLYDYGTAGYNTTGNGSKGKKKSKTSGGGSEWIMTDEVYEEIRKTIGRMVPEQGGILGSSDGKHIDHFFHDKSAYCSRAAYTMNAEALNRVIHDWNDHDIQLIGVIHSHPKGLIYPSAGDMETARHIIETVDVKGKFFTPIVQVSPKLDGTIDIYSYTFEQTVKMQPNSLIIEKTAEEDSNKRRASLAELDRKAPNRFKRIESIFPDNLMQKKTVICIGCGGSRAFLESLARCGVGKFVLWDGDKIEDTNIATQNAYISEIGQFKCDVIKKRILDINPLADVRVVNCFLDSTVSDDDFARKTGILKCETEHTLLLGCTDNFLVQDRCAQLSIKYGVPYLAAQIFAGGKGHEVIFSYPDVTTSCPRCMLVSRYKKMLASPKAAATGSSEGAAVCVTDYLNAIKSYMALILLCYNEKKTPYYRVLDRFADRNYLMTKCANDFTAPAFESIEALEGTETDLSFPFLTVAIEQYPEADCPLCGGKGTLKSMKGTIANTRYIAGRRFY